MKISKKDCYRKLEYYSKEITKRKPSFDTVFRIYYDSLFLVSKILYNIEENPWHPENDYSEEIFETINEYFEELEKLKLTNESE
jgi:hypothetical protein